MTRNVFVVLSLLASLAYSQSVDPGWIKLNGDRYKAETGRSEFVLAEVLAWEATQPQDVQIGKAKLRTYADGSVELVSGPIIIAGATNGAFEIWVDSETGLVLSTLDHASPRKTQADKDADKAKKKAQIAAVKAATTEKDKLAALLVLLGLEDAP